MDTTQKLEYIKENVRVYDLPRIPDRYTAVLMDKVDFRTKGFGALIMSENPYAPEGVGVFGKAKLGRHLGVRVSYRKLPQACQRLLCEVLFEGRKL